MVTATDCRARIVVITDQQVVARILAHLRLPVAPQMLDDACTMVWDVTDPSWPAWVVGADPEPPDEDARGPPGDDFHGIDPSCPED